eukprot:TRINITY_DN26695_c0_g1_i1.p1 TRINITY_DN26695_c0_g1~~TRINITY_DN26695_c0_g1_i1.p1  ORF type:complete len:577 (-),score=63.39 TRINITY_DN26695_c0_g1_i1:40-1770(-)
MAAVKPVAVAIDHMEEGEYPIQLGLAYMFLAGYLARSVFVSLKLPASVGVMFSGFLFSYFFQDQMHDARNELQELAFFLVLLTAGLDISLSDLKPHIFLIALLPCSLEMLAIAAYAVIVLEFTILEGLVLGSILFALGDGLVIPKMKEFQTRFSKHPLPRLIFICVPLEASYALVVFGVLRGLAAPGPSVSLLQLILANALRLSATVLVGAGLGYACARFVEARGSVTVFGRPLFTGEPVEAFIVLISVALLAFGIGSKESGNTFLPIEISSGSVFQPELIVIVIGAVFSDYVKTHTLHSVEQVLGGTWVFGQIVLFSMLGSRTSTDLLPRVVHVLPIIGVGLIFRLLGVSLAMLLTVESRAAGTKSRGGSATRASILPHIMFGFLATLPRATIQGALGNIPLHDRFFAGDEDKASVDEFMSMSAKLYIVVMAVCGMIMLNTFGPKMLEISLDSADAEGGSYAEVNSGEEPRLKSDCTAILALSGTLSLSPDELVRVLRALKLETSESARSRAHDLLADKLSISSETLTHALHAASFKDLELFIAHAESESSVGQTRERTGTVHQFDTVAPVVYKN